MHFIVRDHVGLIEAEPQNLRDRFSAYEIAGVPRVLPAEEEFRAFERLRGELFVLVPRPKGNKIARGEADSSAATRGKEGAPSLPDPAFARAFFSASSCRSDRCCSLLQRQDK